MKFEVTILGSSAALPTLERNATAQYVICQNKHLLIDCGEGTQLQMRKYGLPLQKLSVILISHLHGDHFFGLIGLVSSMRLLGRTKNLKIVGPKGLKELIIALFEAGDTRFDFEIEFVELENAYSGVIHEDNSLEVITFPLKHRIETWGYRIQEKVKERPMKKSMLEDSRLKVEFIHRLKKGEDVELENGEVLMSVDFTELPKKTNSYAYCSDTAYWETIVPHIKGATVLYHEATFIEKDKARAKKTFHATAIQAAKIAKMAEVGKLYMGHLSARYPDGSKHEEEARTEFPESYFVIDGQVIRIDN